MTTEAERVQAGEFTAVFPDGERARQFFERVSGKPEDWNAEPGSVRLNRKGGRQVSWKAAPAAWRNTTFDANPTPELGIRGYWVSMAETVGYYGSSFGEPPWGTGRKTAYLNGMACPASM